MGDLDPSEATGAEPSTEGASLLFLLLDQGAGPQDR